MSTPHSSMYNERDETTKQLTFDSQLDTTGNTEWWKNLEPSDSEHNVSTNSKRNHSAVIAKRYVLETSTSESEKEVVVRKKKAPLRAASRKSGSNAFINALNDTKAISPSSTLAKRQTKDSVLHTNASSRETSQKGLRENNEDSSDSSSTVQIVKVRPSIFKRSKKRETNDQNGFQDVLAENDIAGEKLNIIQKRSSRHSMHKIIDTNKSRDNNQSNITESPRSVLSSSITKKRLSNITAPQVEADNDRSVTMNLSLNDKEIHKKKHVFLKPKSKILTRYNKSESLTENLFEEALMEDVVLEPKSGLLGRTHNRKSIKDSIEKILEDDDIDTEDNTAASTKNDRTSVKRNKATKVSQVRASPVTEETLQLRDRNTLGSPPIYHNMPIEVSRKNVSSNTSKLNSSKTTRTLPDFFKTQEPSAVNKPSVSTDRHLARSQVFMDTEKMEKVKQKLEKIKKREMAAMKIDAGKIDKNKFIPSAKSARLISAALQRVAQKPSAKPAKVVDKAYLVNGEMYKAPRLPRPKHWATDHLYKFLWRRMEPKYGLATRMRSEKFVQELAKMVSLITRRKKYDNYKAESIALMKEMARLQIISTRNDFYHFCYDFLPYEFRVKVVPMLLPGNKKNIPYNPENLHTPLLNE